MSDESEQKGSKYLAALTLGALGVVYGDIGTSPLYALRECFGGTHGVGLTPPEVLGVLSLVFWILTIVVCVKYLVFVLRADNKGEGGVLSLLSLSVHRVIDPSRQKAAQRMIYLGLFGAALMYGDGVITPAISVLSAVEGVSIVAPFLSEYIVPITAGILILLFSVQSRGTGIIGKVFGPIILLWFITLGVLGCRAIIAHPTVLVAVNPYYAIHFLLTHGSAFIFVLGGVFLTITGAESLYADMGHFGRSSIRLGWFLVAYPSLVLNYFGQGALLLSSPSSITNPFFLLAPDWFRLPLVILATFSTVIASQAVISGAFSITRQAVQLGYLPRIGVAHTSSAHIGQIYISLVNTLLLIGTLWLVFEFKSSSRLASAYGIAVSTTMIITTLIMYIVLQKVFNWRKWQAALFLGVFLLIDLTLWTSNLIKIHDGGWFPLALGIFIFTLMTTWYTGRKILAARLRAGLLPLEAFVKELSENPPLRVPGFGIFLSRNVDGVPPSLKHHLDRNQVLHQTVILLLIETREVPYVESYDRACVEGLGNGFYRVIAHYGFMQSPSVLEILSECRNQGIEIDLEKTTYFVGTETIIATSRPGMAIWREKLFAFMARNAERPTEFFKIPRDRVFEIGMQVEI